jgi:hypothetical protein
VTSSNRVPILRLLNTELFLGIKKESPNCFVIPYVSWVLQEVPRLPLMRWVRSSQKRKQRVVEGVCDEMTHYQMSKRTTDTILIFGLVAAGAEERTRWSLSSNVLGKDAVPLVQTLYPQRLLGMNEGIFVFLCDRQTRVSRYGAQRLLQQSEACQKVIICYLASIAKEHRGNVIKYHGGKTKKKIINKQNKSQNNCCW